jgi:type VI secretion system secreted protein Hcp
MRARTSFSPIQKLLIYVVGLTGVFLAPSAMAQTLETFMKIDGIPGDSTVIGHENEIVLSSYSQTFATKNCSKVVALKFVDRASPGLITAAAGNALLPSVVITIRKPGAPPLEFFKAILGTVLIERIDLGNDTGPLVEQVVLKPRTIRIEFRPQDNRGQLLPPIVTEMTCS